MQQPQQPPQQPQQQGQGQQGGGQQGQGVGSLAPFEKTVAGSTHFLFAKDFPGRVFKPAHPAEKDFYENIDKGPHHDPQLKALVPKYHGSLSYMPSGPEHQAAEYLVMEDLTYGFTHPCILDVKLGTTHHGISFETCLLMRDIDFANPQKHAGRQSKYLTAPALGFCLTGMQVYKSASGSFEFMDKAEGRNLTPTTVVSKLQYFFQDANDNTNDNGFRRDVISKLIQRLSQVAAYFQSKPAYTFRSSSLLLLYEGKKNAESADRVEVKMIDFAHAKRLPVSADGQVEFKDEYGYLYGTNNFIKILETLQQTASASATASPTADPTAPPPPTATDSSLNK